MTEKQTEALRTTIDRLEHSLSMARVAIDGNEPEAGAVYVANTLDDVKAHLRRLRDVRDATVRGWRSE